MPPFKCISYHLEGWVNFKWGSLAKIGFPVVDFFPETTQLFEPMLTPFDPVKSLILYSWVQRDENNNFILGYLSL